MSTSPAATSSEPTAPRAAPVSALATCAPLALLAAAALTALALHLLLPNRQLLPISWMDSLPLWQHPYPIVLFSFALTACLLMLPCVTSRTACSWLHHHAPLVTGAIGLLLFWDLITQKLNWMQLPYFPGPDLVFGAIVEDRNILLKSAAQSLLLLLCGYLVGVLAGVATGVFIGWFPRARYWGMPALKLVGPLPATALVPLAMTLSNNSFLPGVGLIAFAVWFPVTMLTASGIASVRHAYLDVARTLGADSWYLVWRVAIPAALPHIFIGLFMGLGASFLTLIVAETVGVQAGLGWYVAWRRGAGMEYANVYGALLLMSAFFSTLMTLLFKLRDRVLRWQKGLIQW